MNIAFIIGLLVGIPLGAFVALTYSGMVFVLLARLAIAMMSYKFERDERKPWPAKEPKPDSNDEK